MVLFEFPYEITCSGCWTTETLLSFLLQEDNLFHGGTLGKTTGHCSPLPDTDLHIPIAAVAILSFTFRWFPTGFL